MYYTVYKITNMVNNNIYIGVHATEDLHDSYMGSGFRIKRAIKKYGIENFKKDILFVYDTKNDALNEERKIVDEDFVLRKDTYNMVLGGGSPPSQKGKSFAIKKQSLTADNRTVAQKHASMLHSKKMKGRVASNKGIPGKGKSVKTPDGIFRTGMEACKYYNISSGALHNRCKKKLYGFEFWNE